MVPITRNAKESKSDIVENLHNESQQLKSQLKFMLDELTFINHLLNSYVFEPKTPNCFERLQDFTSQIQRQKNSRELMEKLIDQHENDLWGMLQCTEGTCDTLYNLKHEKVKAEVISCLEDFRNLKSEVFLYAGEILKKRKA